MAINVVVSGATGRMGQTLLRLIADDPRFELVGGIDKTRMSEAEANAHGFKRIESADSAATMIRDADVVIDFSAVAGLQALLSQRAKELAGKGVVIGTTGLTPDVQQLISDAAQRSAIVVAANFSVAVNLMLGLAETAAAVLGPDRYDVEIVEAHHKRKVDAPSGTALALAQAIAAARNVQLDDVRKDGRSGAVGARRAGEIGIHALRGGEIVGEHRVHFVGTRDRLELAHIAQDRGLFAEGALLAAAWVHGRAAGKYAMSEVLGLSRAPH